VVELSAPGKVVPAGETSLHVVDEGRGEPPIVLCAGLGGSHVDWDPVAERLCRDHRVIRYDRPGLGFSPPAPVDRRPMCEATLLRAALAAIDAPPPYVLVGHSMGALVVRAYAAQFPAEAAGAVFVDPFHEDSLDLAAWYRRLAQAVTGSVRLLAFLAPVGGARVAAHLARLANRAQLAEPASPDGARFLDVSAALGARPSALRSVAADYAGLSSTIEQMQELSRTEKFPDVPLTVISAGRLPKGRRQRELLRGNQALHARLAELSPRGRHVMAERSGHQVTVDQPDLIAAEVDSMVRELR
jgi:pimeloyl-ACP methyl ester carboxylesterase